MLNSTALENPRQWKRFVRHRVGAEGRSLNRQKMRGPNNKLRFEINLGAGKRAGLVISSQLPKLADSVVQ